MAWITPRAIVWSEKVDNFLGYMISLWRNATNISLPSFIRFLNHWFKKKSVMLMVFVFYIHYLSYCKHFFVIMLDIWIPFFTTRKWNGSVLAKLHVYHIWIKHPKRQYWLMTDEHSFLYVSNTSHSFMQKFMDAYLYPVPLYSIQYSKIPY